MSYALEKGVEYAEARTQRQIQEALTLRNGFLEAYVWSVDSGFCIRVIADGGVGFASSNKCTREEAREIVDLAVKHARAARRLEKLVFAREKTVEAEWTVEQKQRLEDVSPEDKVAKLAEVNKAVASCSVNIAASLMSCTVSLTSKYYVNSEGTRLSSFTPRIGAYSFITVIEQGKAEQAYQQFGYCGGWEAFKEWNMEQKIIHDAEVLRQVILNGKAVKPGIMDLICGPSVTGIAAHESCGHPMEADRVLGREMSQAGRSFIYKGGPYWIGSQIGSSVVTIVDDPTLPNSYGYYAYDDEGVRARRRYLYSNGVINEFLHNRETAAKLETGSNAASRSINYDREAIVRMANTFVLPGDYGEEELIEDVKHGVYMKSFTEWNIDDKRFNQRYVGREAYLIENGEVGQVLARPIIETTTEKFWTAVDAVSRKVEFEAATCGKGDPMQGVPVLTGGPCIRLRRVYIK